MRHVLIVSCIGLILTFQNCSQAQFDAEAEQQSFESQLPFAYEAKIDTIAYMSCSGMSDNQPDRRAYFTIRAGAYGTCNPADYLCQQNPFASPVAGLSMSKDFREATKYYDKKQKAHLFSMSDKNANTFLSLSIRSAGNYQLPWKEGNLVAGEELDAMLPALDTPAVAGPLGFSSEGQMMNYFPGSHTQRLMEGSLRYYNFENTSKLTRDTLNSREALMVMGYSTTADPMETGLRSPDQAAANQPQLPTNRAYGTGFYLSFELPTGPGGVRMSSGEQRALSTGNGVEEVDLITGQPTSASWDCSYNYQFMVVRPEDKANGLVTCDATVDRYANATEQAALNAIRRVLRVEDWFVDVARRCIMPKRTGDYCYGAVQGRTIQYGQANCLNNATTMCPHIVSVCVRR
jgi:hypothetical protein